MDKNSPKEFNWNICGHEKISDFFKKSVVNGRLAQAYIFWGQSHLGKFTLAQEFIGSIFCLAGGKNVPCGECLHCRQLKKGLHPDVYLVEKKTDEKTGKQKKEIVIDQIRDLKSRLQQGTLLNSYKAAIIPEAQYLNENAANALLKLLEEPTPKTIIILIADDIKKLPATIVSRSQALKFLPVAEKKIERFLAERGLAQEAARWSIGRPGLALVLAQDESAVKQRREQIEKFLKIMPLNLGLKISAVEDLIDWEKDEAANVSHLNALLDVWQSVLRDLLLLKNNNQPLVANFDFFDALLKASSFFTRWKISVLLKEISLARAYFSQNINAKFILENLIIKL